METKVSKLFLLLYLSLCLCKQTHELFSRSGPRKKLVSFLHTKLKPWDDTLFSFILFLGRSLRGSSEASDFFISWKNKSTLTPLLDPNLLSQAEEETPNEEMISQSSPATVDKNKNKDSYVMIRLPQAIIPWTSWRWRQMVKLTFSSIGCEYSSTNFSRNILFNLSTSHACVQNESWTPVGIVFYTSNVLVEHKIKVSREKDGGDPKRF